MEAKFDNKIKNALFKDLRCGDCFCIYTKTSYLSSYTAEYRVYIKISDDEDRNALSLPCSLAHIDPDKEVIIPTKAEIVIEGLGKGYCR